MRRSRVHPKGPVLAPLFVLPCLFTLAGCGAGGGHSSGTRGYTVRDSAGIAIVDNTTPAWSAGTGWRVSPGPLLTVGVMEGAQEYILFRAHGALRLRDGRIVVANSGTGELRFYDSNGVFLRSVGRTGEGPGEFGSLGTLWRTDLDSLVVYDYRLRRFSVFDGTGTFVRSFQLGQGSGEFAYPAGVFGDGTVLASIDEEDQGNYSKLGFVQGRQRYGRYDRDGQPLASLASLPGSELYKGTHADGSGFTTSADHAARPFAAAGPSAWYYGSGSTFEFQKRGREGRLLSIIRLNRTRRAMPEAVRTARENALRKMRPQAAALWGSIPLPDSLPTHSTLMVDRAGDLWVEGYVVLEEEPFWSVFDPDGRWLGDLTPPTGLRITDAGTDYLMGVWADSLGVQQVRVYGLERDDAS